MIRPLPYVKRNSSLIPTIYCNRDGEPLAFLCVAWSLGAQTWQSSVRLANLSDGCNKGKAIIAGTCLRCRETIECWICPLWGYYFVLELELRETPLGNGSERSVSHVVSTGLQTVVSIQPKPLWAWGSQEFGYNRIDFLSGKILDMSVRLPRIRVPAVWLGQPAAERGSFMTNSDDVSGRGAMLNIMK